MGLNTSNPTNLVGETVDVTDDQRRSADWDIHSGPKNYATMVASQTAAALLTFAATWLSIRALGPMGYGNFAAILIVSQCLSQLFINWSATAVSRFGCEEFVSEGRIAKAFWARLILLSVNLIAVLTIFPLLFPAIVGWFSLSWDIYPYIVMHLIISSLVQHVQQSLQAAKLPRVQSALLCLDRGMICLVLLVLFILDRATLSGIVATYILVPLIPLTMGVYRLRSLLYPFTHPDLNFLRQMIIYALPLAPHAVVGYFSTSYVDSLFIAFYLSKAHLGVYQLANQITGQVMQLPLLLGSLLLTYFITLESHHSQERISRFFRYVLPLLSLTWSFFCCAFAMLLGMFLPWIFSSEFREIKTLLWPLMAAVAASGPYMIAYVPLCNARSVTYIAMVMSIVCAATNVGLDFLLIPYAGLLGSAWSTMITYVVGVTVTFFMVEKRFTNVRSWAPLTVLPPVLGSVASAYSGNGYYAMGVSLLMTMLMAFLFRHNLLIGWSMIVPFWQQTLQKVQVHRS